MSNSTLWRNFYRVVETLNKLAPSIIVWPSLERRQQIKRKFFEIAGLPNIIGAVDGTYVPIKAPMQDPEVYVTRKCNHAFTAQGICDADLKFTDVFIGYPGSVSDTRIFKNSPIYEDIMINRDELINNGEYIIGDKAYPVLDWCIPPYIDRGNLTPAQRRFNTVHARHRATIERCWALLFGRYRRLKFLDMSRTDLIPSTVLACCVLHNICLDHENLLNYNHEYEDEGRQILMYPDDNEEIIAHNRGMQYRDELCEMVFNINNIF
jgi:hypothetical protein